MTVKEKLLKQELEEVNKQIAELEAKKKTIETKIAMNYQEEMIERKRSRGW